MKDLKNFNPRALIDKYSQRKGRNILNPNTEQNQKRDSDGRFLPRVK